ncbi:hypothetical protein ACFX15_031781 [Malus domestica]
MQARSFGAMYSLGSCMQGAFGAVCSFSSWRQGAFGVAFYAHADQELSAMQFRLVRTRSFGAMYSLGLCRQGAFGAVCSFSSCRQ